MEERKIKSALVIALIVKLIVAGILVVVAIVFFSGVYAENKAAKERREHMYENMPSYNGTVMFDEYCG